MTKKTKKTLRATRTPKVNRKDNPTASTAGDVSKRIQERLDALEREMGRK